MDIAEDFLLILESPKLGACVPCLDETSSSQVLPVSSQSHTTEVNVVFSFRKKLVYSYAGDTLVNEYLLSCQKAS